MGFLNVRKITANNGISSNESFFLKKMCLHLNSWYY